MNIPQGGRHLRFVQQVHPPAQIALQFILVHAMDVDFVLELVPYDLAQPVVVEPAVLVVDHRRIRKRPHDAQKRRNALPE